MTDSYQKRAKVRTPSCELLGDFPALSRRILRYANRNTSLIVFKREVSRHLLAFSGCDAIEIITQDGDVYHQCNLNLRPEESFRFGTLPHKQGEGLCSRDTQRNSALGRLCASLSKGFFDPSHPSFTNNGSFWTGDTDNSLDMSFEAGEDAQLERINLGGKYKSLAIISFAVDEKDYGLVLLKSMSRYFLTKKDVEFYEGVVQALGVAISCWRAQSALHERVKELTCLYNIAKVVEQPGTTVAETLQKIAEILPPAWQYPEMTHTRIYLDGEAFFSRGFKDGKDNLTSEIVVDKKCRGKIEIVYSGKRLEFDRGPFLKEEQSLIKAVAREIGVAIGMKEAESEKSRLNDQLLHADRLATIGQFAAGVAHELNEPLGKILGFAQLSKKYEGLPASVDRDIDKIVKASVHAREIVGKLLIFSRRMPKQDVEVDLNKLINEELYFFESQCDRQAIEFLRSLEHDLPPVIGDPAQLNQVLVNLVINSIQAMPDGGTLKISTSYDDGFVSVTVEDTGIGMTEEVKNRIFIPFFSTKDVGEGTGLGLSVVHGIVTSHQGSIKVESEVGRGSKFEVVFPKGG